MGMKTPPLAGSVVRVGVGLLLCAACFQSGRWYQTLTSDAAETAAVEAKAAVAEFVGPQTPALPVVPAATAAPGDPEGHGGDIITPLNVRDPSALVMGPGDYHPKCPQLDPVAPEGRLVEPLPYKPPKAKKMKEGRLLELLKKEDKKSVYPKRY